MSAELNEAVAAHAAASALLEDLRAKARTLAAELQAATTSQERTAATVDDALGLHRLGEISDERMAEFEAAHEAASRAMRAGLSASNHVLGRATEAVKALEFATQRMRAVAATDAAVVLPPYLDRAKEHAAALAENLLVAFQIEALVRRSDALASGEHATRVSGVALETMREIGIVIGRDRNEISHFAPLESKPSMTPADLLTLLDTH